MHVLFRVDANSKIGLGHLSRCIILAKALLKNAVKVTFLTESNSRIDNNLISSLGIHLIELPEISLLESESFSQQDVLRCIAIIQHLQKVDWVVIDQKNLGVQWQQQIANHCQWLMVFDDAEEQVQLCDVLLNYNPRDNYTTALRYQNLVKANRVENTQLLLGPKYALINENFLSEKPRIKPEKITVGLFFGSFPAESILPFIEPLIEKMIEFSDIKFHLVHQNINAFEALCKFENVTAERYLSMQFFLQKVDLVIGTTGVAALERVANGMPTINLMIEGHAHLGIKALAKQGCCSLVELDKQPDLCQALTSLKESQAYQAQSSACIEFSKNIQGAEAIVKVMKEYEF